MRDFVLLDYPKARQLLDQYHVKTVDAAVAHGEKDAVELARKLGYPVALKVLSPEIVHKTDIGALRLNLKNDGQVHRAYRAILKAAGKARVTGVLVQKMAKPGLELIVGGKRDPQFGPIVLFGLGGILVEAMGDFSVRVCPVHRDQAHEMLGEIKAARILEGVRGKPPVDKAAIAHLITEVSRMMEERPRIRELDLNPVIAYHEGYVIVDARIMVD